MTGKPELVSRRASSTCGKAAIYGSARAERAWQTLRVSSPRREQTIIERTQETLGLFLRGNTAKADGGRGRDEGVSW